MSFTIEVQGLAELQKKLGSLEHELRGVRATLANPTVYGPWVGSSRFQARVHRKRWPTDEGSIERELPNIEADFQTAIDAALGSAIITRNPILVGAHAALLRLQNAMTKVPPPPSGSTYVRTNTYIRAWVTNYKETLMP